MSNAYDFEDPNGDPESAYWGPMGRMGQPGAKGLPPPMPPPMPSGPAQGGGGGDGPPPGPGPNLMQPAPPPGFPMPPPMGPPGQAFQADPFNKALDQAGTATQMFSPSAPGIGAPKPPPPMPPPMPGSGSAAGGPQGPNGGPSGPPGPGNGVPFGPSTDYASAMGIAPTAQNRMTSALGGFGKGLSAAAGNSNKAGAVFSRGAGGAITGQIGEAQEQQKVAQGLQNQYFNQASTAFKDWNAKRSSDSLEVYRQSLAAWNNAKIAAGGPGAKVFLNSPEGKLHLASQEAQQNYERDSKNLALLKNVIPSDDYLKRYDELEGKHKQYLADAYKKYGVDPKGAENLQTRGFDLPRKWSEIQNGQYYVDQNGTPQRKSPKSTDFKPDDTVQWINPFPASKMDVNTFHQTVPEESWYESNGQLFRRKLPPPAAPAVPQMQSPAQPSGLADPRATYGDAAQPFPPGVQ